MRKTEELMNTKRGDCAAFGNYNKADAKRKRNGNDWWNSRVAHYERLNRSQPVLHYKLKDFPEEFNAPPGVVKI